MSDDTPPDLPTALANLRAAIMDELLRVFGPAIDRLERWLTPRR